MSCGMGSFSKSCDRHCDKVGLVVATKGISHVRSKKLRINSGVTTP